MHPALTRLEGYVLLGGEGYGDVEGRFLGPVHWAPKSGREPAMSDQLVMYTASW